MGGLTLDFQRETDRKTQRQTDRQTENSELYYSMIEVLGNSLF